LIVLTAVLAVSEPAWAANKDMERLQIQIGSLQGQLEGLQRVIEENRREVQRLNELLAEQTALVKKALQEQSNQDESTRTSLKDIADRLAELDTRVRAQAMPAPLMPGTIASPVPGGAATGPTAPGGPGGLPPQALPSSRELYSQAYADYARGNYDLAMQGFQEYLKNYPGNELSDNAQYWIGECLYGKQRYADAIEAWNTLLRDFPSSDKLPDARVKKGMALEKQGRRSQALLEYRYVVEHYPGSPAARIARDKLNP
jgi:tol-pal system protein YbgF